MKISIEGDEKKIKQLIKELTPRCKRDKVKLILPKEKKKEEVKSTDKVKK